MRRLPFLFFYKVKKEGLIGDEEVKEKIRKSLLGKKQSIETRKRKSISLLRTET